MCLSQRMHDANRHNGGAAWCPTTTQRGPMAQPNQMRKRAAEKAARDEASHVVERWNCALAAGHDALWPPAMRCALTAGMPWLDVYCPCCRTSRAIDIRTIDRHPLASVGSLVLGVRCSSVQAQHRWP
jgi:hypothetical protein